MTKKEFIKYLEDIFESCGFDKKRNRWVSENREIVKIIDVQKSKFGNSYYLNYGFVLKKLDLEKLTMHVFKGLGSLNDKENRRIIELLDLDKSISEEERKSELKSYIKKYILEELEKTNTETDVLNGLRKRPHLNDVPLLVKKYFSLV